MQSDYITDKFIRLRTIIKARRQIMSQDIEINSVPASTRIAKYMHIDNKTGSNKYRARGQNH